MTPHCDEAQPLITGEEGKGDSGDDEQSESGANSDVLVTLFPQKALSIAICRPPKKFHQFNIPNSISFY